MASAPGFLTYTSAFTDRSGEPALRIWKTDGGDYLRLDYSDGHQFWLDRKGSRVWAVWPVDSSVEEITAYLLGPVMGILLRNRGVLCLHASAVAMNDQAVAFVGPPGAGKSTMAAALSQRGYMVLADDITTVEPRNGTFYVQPAYPGVNLWPDSLNLLYGALRPPAEPVANGEKRCLSIDEGLRFESRSLPLERIYILNCRNSSDPASCGPTSAQSLFLSLVANTYASNILDIQMRADELAVLGRIAAAVRICPLPPERNPSRMSRFCDLIANDKY